MVKQNYNLTDEQCQWLGIYENAKQVEKALKDGEIHSKAQLEAMKCFLTEVERMYRALDRFNARYKLTM